MDDILQKVDGICGMKLWYFLMFQMWHEKWMK